MVDSIYEEKLERVLQSLRILLSKKHSDYGNDNLKKHGMFGIIVRMSDKLARLENLNGKQGMVEESIKDTLLDLAGYAIQAIVLFYEKE